MTMELVDPSTAGKPVAAPLSSSHSARLRLAPGHRLIGSDVPGTLPNVQGRARDSPLAEANCGKRARLACFDVLPAPIFRCGSELFRNGVERRQLSRRRRR